MEKETLLQLDPAHILADDNSRFNLKRVLVDKMMESITERGGVIVPVEVEELVTPTNGFTHRLTAGFIRREAAERLNKEQSAGIKIPARVMAPVDALDRLKRQLAENVERGDLSPMDKATAINKLMAAGVPVLDIRKMFATLGGKKGNTFEMASNAHINMMLSFLEFPKAIQDKIHDGRLGVKAAYELTKVSKEQQADILAAAEAARLKVVEAEEAEEVRFLNSQKKVEQATKKAEEAVQTVEETKASVKVAAELITAKTKALRDFQKVNLLDLEDKARRKVLESMKAAEMDLKGAQQSKKAAENKLAKQIQAAKSAEEKAADKAAVLEQKRKLAKGKKPSRGVSSEDIKTATTGGLVALNASQIREALKDIVKATSQPIEIRNICQAILDCCIGKTTPKLMGEELVAIAGGMKGKAKAVK